MSAKGNVKNNTLNFEFSNSLEMGLYTILSIRSIEDKFKVGDDNDTVHSLCAFTILGNNNKNPMELYKYIYKMRDTNFNRFKGNTNNNDNINFHVFVFCKNILVSTCTQYDDVQIFCNSYFEYKKSYVQNQHVRNQI